MDPEEYGSFCKTLSLILLAQQNPRGFVYNMSGCSYKPFLKEVGLAEGEMALKSVFKDLGPKECKTSVDHRGAGSQQVPRCSVSFS